jgi:hypothetical protein
MAIRGEIIYNDGLTVWVKRVSTRRMAEFIATTIRERGLQARAHDRGWTTWGSGVPKNQRYEVLVRGADFHHAHSIVQVAMEEHERIHKVA